MYAFGMRTLTVKRLTRWGFFAGRGFLSEGSFGERGIFTGVDFGRRGFLPEGGFGRRVFFRRVVLSCSHKMIVMFHKFHWRNCLLY